MQLCTQLSNLYSKVMMSRRLGEVEISQYQFYYFFNQHSQ